MAAIPSKNFMCLLIMVSSISERNKYSKNQIAQLEELHEWSSQRKPLKISTLFIKHHSFFGGTIAMNLFRFITLFAVINLTVSELPR